MSGQNLGQKVKSSKNYCEHSRGHSLSPIFIKRAQNDRRDNISVKFEYGLCWIKN